MQFCMAMPRTTTSFLAVLFTALAFVPAGAHVAEIGHKMQLGQVAHDMGILARVVGLLELDCVARDDSVGGA